MSSIQARAVRNASAFTPGRGLRGLAGFAAAGAAISLAGAAGYGIPCPWRAFTGTLCPLCGATHLGVRLLHGDVAGAFWANPFVFALLAVLAGLGVVWTVAALGGPIVRLPRRLVGLPADRWWLALAVLGVGFAVVRNVV